MLSATGDSMSEPAPKPASGGSQGSSSSTPAVRTAKSTRVFTPLGTRRPIAQDTGAERYGKDNNDLLLRIFAILDEGRRHLLRKRYVDMLGIGHLNDVEQEKMLFDNRAYQRALSDMERQNEVDKRALRGVFDRAVSAPPPKTPEEELQQRVLHERLTLRRERLSHVREAQSAKFRRLRESYEAKKRLYDQKFETVEQDAYAKGAARIEEDRARYEQLSRELDDRMKKEQEAIDQAQKALEEIEKTREQAEKEMVNARLAEEEIRRRVTRIVGQLRDTLPELEQLVEKLVPPKEE